MVFPLPFYCVNATDVGRHCRARMRQGSLAVCLLLTVEERRLCNVMYDVIDHVDSNFKQMHTAIYLVLANSRAHTGKRGVHNTVMR
jgi:hypothetical protein